MFCVTVGFLKVVRTTDADEMQVGASEKIGLLFHSHSIFAVSFLADNSAMNS